MEKYFVTKTKIVKVVASVIYEFAPGNAPRGINKIMTYVRNWCCKNFKDYDKWTKSEITSNFFKMLYGCKEFTQLNISQYLWDRGVRDYNDQSNRGFSVTAVAHDKNGNPTSVTRTKEYYDFVDLDACINGIIREYIINAESSEDCFLCKHSKGYMSLLPSDNNIRGTCTLHPDYKCNYEPHPKSLIPHIGIK